MRLKPSPTSACRKKKHLRELEVRPANGEKSGPFPFLSSANPALQSRSPLHQTMKSHADLGSEKTVKNNAKLEADQYNSLSAGRSATTLNFEVQPSPAAWAHSRPTELLAALPRSLNTSTEMREAGAGNFKGFAAQRVSS